MARFDIMPWKSPGAGGHVEVRYGEFTASEVFEAGEPVSLVDAGTWTEPPDDNGEWLIADGGGNVEFGIAAWGPGASNINPATGVAYATGDWFPYYPANNQTQLWITQNFYAAGGATNVAPALTDIGDEYQISYGAAKSKWGIERTVGIVGVDVIASIVDVLDSRKAPIRVTGNAGVYVTFEIKPGTLAKVT